MKVKKKTIFDPLWYEYRPNKGYFYGPGAGKALHGQPVVFWSNAEPHPLPQPMEVDDPLRFLRRE